MKYISEFRDPASARAICDHIRVETRPERSYRFMEFCGGHTHAIFRHGIPDLLPSNIRLIHGPGCPVCVLPTGCIDAAISCAEVSRENRPATLAAYGDALRVPGSSGRSLLKARSEGKDVRMVYSPLDAVELAAAEPERDFIFFAIGFETTAPATALAVREALRRKLRNFFVFSCHVLTPPAIRSILESPQVREIGRVELDGFLGPAHVSTVIGTKPYEYFAEEFQKPVVVAGFEPLDVMQAILMLVRQVNENRAEVENQYIRAVTPEGNLLAQRAVVEIFEMRKTFEWRGLGEIPYSGLRLRDEFAAFDAERVFGITIARGKENPACECGAILRGARLPADCPLFGSICTPENPMGSCMVSSEGACAAWYTFRGWKADG